MGSFRRIKDIQLNCAKVLETTITNHNKNDFQRHEVFGVTPTTQKRIQSRIRNKRNKNGITSSHYNKTLIEIKSAEIDAIFRDDWKTAWESVRSTIIQQIVDVARRHHEDSKSKQGRLSYFGEEYKILDLPVKFISTYVIVLISFE